MAEQGMAEETQQLLRTAVARASKVRAAIAEMREHAFASAAAASSGGSPTHGVSPERRALHAGAAGNSSLQVLPLLLLPQGVGQAGSPELKALASQLPPSLSLGSAASMGSAAQVGAAPGDCHWLPTGEHRASPKTSQRKPWGSPGSSRRQQQQDEQQHPAGSGGAGPSFEEVLAALRAEGFVGQTGAAPDPVDREAHVCLSGSPQHRLPKRSSFTGGVERRSRGDTSPARGDAGSTAAAGRASARSARRSLDSGAGSSMRRQSTGAQYSQGGRHRRQQQEQQQPSDALTTFNLMEAERQLREKMEQVNAAKRYNDARMRSSGGTGMVATPRGLPAVPVPRLPLASLGRAGSAASSRQNSSRLSGRENDQPQRPWRPWQLQGSSPPRSPPAAGRRPAAAASEEQAPPNFLPLAREERARPAAAGSGAGGAVPPPSASKESRISLTELLSTTPGPSKPAAPSRSEESPSAAGAAPAEQGSLQGLRQSGVSPSGACSPSASTSTAGGWKAAVAAAAEAAALREQQEAARQQAEAEEAVQASSGARLELAAPGELSVGKAPGANGSVRQAAGSAATVDVVPGEAAAPPIQDTPRDGAAGEEAPVQLATEGPSVVGSSRHLPGCGKLQSPPATPLEHAPAEARPRPAPLGSGDSSASSSPEQACNSTPPQQHRQVHAGLLPGVPSVGGDQAPPLQPLQQQQLEAGADGTPPPRQQQLGASISAGPLLLPSTALAGDKQVLAEHSSSSIGRKRANSEAGCIEGPTSAKKRSPEVSSGRLVACTAELQAAALEAAAPLQPAAAASAHAQRPQAALFGDAASRGSPGVAGQPQQQHGQQELVQSLPALLPAVQPPAAAGPKPELEQLPLTPAADSHRKFSSSNLVMPVVLEHTPPHQLHRQRREQQQQRDVQQQQQQCQEEQEQRPHNTQQVQPVQQEPQKQPVAAPTAGAPLLRAPTAPVQSAQAANKSAPAAAPAANMQPAHAAPKPEQPAHALTKPEQPAQAAAKPVQPAQAAPKPALPSQTAHLGLPAPAVPAPVLLQRATSTSSLIDSLEEELPAHSQWVSSRLGNLYEQQQQQQPAVQQQQGQPGAAQQRAAGPCLAAAAALPEGELPASSHWVPSRSGSPVQEPEPQATPPPSLKTAAAAAMAATAAAAASMAAHAINITPRQRMAALEPPEAELCLQEHPKGKQLLSAAPELAHMSGDTLLGMVQQGCIVRKAWVRPNFKQGGSTRRVQLAPGSAGRAELLYPHGLFRKPLRFAVRRAVVNSSAWHPGDYLVLDTARGMLRLEPITAAEHALWVVALNAAFLASGAPAASGAGGSSLLGGSPSEDSRARCMQLAVGAMRWSAAILLG